MWNPFQLPETPKKDPILQIMEYIYKHPEEKTEQDLKDEFGEEEFSNFSQVCRGGTKPYVHDHHPPNGRFKLSQDGARAMIEMRSQHTQELANYWTRITAIGAISVTLLGIFVQAAVSLVDILLRYLGVIP